MLTAGGYTVLDPLVVNAVRVGIPQFRRRVLIVGHRRDVTPITHTDFEELNGEGNWISRRTYSGSRPPVTVFDAIGDLEHLIRRGNGDNALILPQGYDRKLKSPYVRMLRLAANGRAYPRIWDKAVLQGVALTTHSPQAIRRFDATPVGSAETISRYPRLDGKGLSNTLRAGTGADHGSHTPPRPIHYSSPRVITVREAARLHSFPDWFQFHETKWHAWRQIGNSVPPKLGRAIGEVILSTLGTNPPRPQKRLLIVKPMRPN